MCALGWDYPSLIGHNFFFICSVYSYMMILVQVTGAC